MKILLADDDKLIRFSLKSMIGDILDSENIIFEASNGKEMITQCIDYTPDIAFVDINMPFLDGISAIQECKKFSSNTQFIILTGYSDFNYAKRCIALGVTDYILKPVSFDYLKTTLTNAVERIEHSKNQQNAYFQLSVLTAFQNLGSPSDSEGQSELCLENGELLTAFTFFIDCKDNDNIYGTVRKNLILRLKDLSSKIALDNDHAIVYSPYGMPRFIFKLSDAQTSYAEKRIMDLCTELCSDKVSVYGFYIHSKHIQNILRGCESIDINNCFRIHLRPGRIQNIQLLDLQSPILDFLKHYSALLTSYCAADGITYEKHASYLTKTYANTSLQLHIPNACHFAKIVAVLDLTAADIGDFCRQIQAVSANIYQNPELKSSPKIDMIIQYIEKSYMNEISINQIAEHFDLTPNYVSKLFHEKTQTKFVDYLTNLRITHAKRLLITNYDTPVKDIAIMCGYFSYRHFSAVFKKLTGTHPTEYRKQH